MAETKKDVVREFYYKVVNEKRLDLIDRYISKNYVAHGFPYVGMGLNTDTSSGRRMVITAVAPESPADGKLEVGDEILMAKDDKNTWSTFNELKDSPWGLGEVGTEITVRVKRGEDTLDLQLTRGLVKSFDVPYKLLKDGFERYLLREWPDIEVSIEAMVEEGDFVACFLSQKGSNAEFERHAVWPSSSFFKVSEGKIVEGWGVEGGTSRLKQLGYEIKPPRNGG